MAHARHLLSWSRSRPCSASARWRPTNLLRRQSVRRRGTYEAAKGDDIYTGSILYMPDTSNVCHQWLFDNQNGQFTDKGSVDCQEAADQSLDGPKNWSAARIRVISTGFRDH